MPPSPKSGPKAPLFIVSGAKGAVGSTVAATAAALKRAPETVLPSLTAPQGSAATEALLKTQIAGWDVSARTLKESLEYHGVLPPENFLPLEEDFRKISILQAPPPAFSFREQVERLIQDIREFKRLHPENQPVEVGRESLIHLLPLFREEGFDLKTMMGTSPI